MKSILIAIAALTSVQASAATGHVVCALKSKADPSHYASIKADLSDLTEDGYYNSDSGVDTGEENYSFDVNIAVTRAGKLDVTATFYESVRAQDEVGQTGWTVDLKKARAGKPILSEKIKDSDGKHILNFVCYYNKR